MIRPLLTLLVLAVPAGAETVLAARTIPARTIIGATDISQRSGTIPGTLADPEAAIGMEARVALYAGRPIRAADIGPPATVERNQIVPLIYEGAGLFIHTEGRALDRGGPGEMIRVMNLSSRATVTATLSDDGIAYVAP